MSLLIQKSELKQFYKFWISTISNKQKSKNTKMDKSLDSYEITCEIESIEWFVLVNK